ncbi:LysR family transcriptional regulator [Lentibacter algarum]|uniref:LysR family transcriptional regulator n=1 Tax=Lentibacter algarum TaxID=576131 RepID=UPI001C098B19|nr:LysR family transcriptional regulator [Lentibacter algarum]MBU2983697.1 LysR family transcriptional regulator [Lentibacter algarum]
MDTVEAIRTLIAVVEHGSFSAAGRRIRVNRSVVSRSIEALEASIGVRLVNRTTRSLSLTEAGRIYYEGAKKILSELDQLKDSVVETKTRLKGSMRVSAPVHFGEWQLLPIVQEFLKRHPGINMRLELNNEHVDIIDGRYDLVVRTAPLLEDSSFVARRISMNSFVPCASPAYCERYGQPKTPDELSKHFCIASIGHSGSKNWVFSGPDQVLVSVPITPRLTLNAGSAQIRAVKEGMGIALLPEYVAKAGVSSGELVSLLEDFEHQNYPIFAIYPHKDMLPIRTRKFLDVLSEALR